VKSTLRLYSLLLLALVRPLCAAINPNAAIDKLVGRDELARPLNAIDLDLQPTDPQPLLSPTGDFNKDGVEDMAISGIYDLAPAGSPRYFFCVATTQGTPPRYATLYFSEYPSPVFIHMPGATGEADPANQAFSISFCSNCDKGFDFYWDAKKKAFRAEPWKPMILRSEKMITTTDTVPPETVDAALRIVGVLPDVKSYVAELKKEKRQLGVRVQTRAGGNPGFYDVRIFEKKGKREELFDVLTVDMNKNAVVAREKFKTKLDSSGAPPTAPNTSK
jgi:hypothetical protein